MDKLLQIVTAGIDLPISVLAHTSKLIFSNFVFVQFHVPLTKKLISDIDGSLTGINLLKINDRNTRTSCEICSKLTNKDTRTTLLASLWCLYC